MRENLTSGSMRGGWRGVLPDQPPTLPVQLVPAETGCLSGAKTPIVFEERGWDDAPVREPGARSSQPASGGGGSMPRAAMSLSPAAAPKKRRDAQPLVRARGRRERATQEEPPELRGHALRSSPALKGSDTQVVLPHRPDRQAPAWVTRSARRQVGDPAGDVRVLVEVIAGADAVVAISYG